METSLDSTVSSRAFGLHTFLHHKHASLLNSRYAENARESFNYQRLLTSDVVRGMSRDLPQSAAPPSEHFALARRRLSHVGLRYIT